MLLFLPPELKRDPAYPKGSKRSVLMRSSLTAAKCPGKFTQPGVHYGTSPTAIGWPVPLPKAASSNFGPSGRPKCDFWRLRIGRPRRRVVVPGTFPQLFFFL
jgi:hypothetical protein